MTTFAPNPSNPHVPTPTITKVRWDTIAIVAAGLVMALAAGYLAFHVAGGESAPTASRTPAAPKAQEPTVETTPDALGLAALDADDAASIVTEARELMDAANWDAAADRLALVTGDLAETSGARALLEELTTTRAQWSTLTAQLDRQIQGRDWDAALTTFDELERVATLDDALAARKTEVLEAIAAAKQPKPKPEPETSGGGGGKPATTPGATAPTTRPPAVTPKPAAAKPATKPASGTKRPAKQPTTPSINSGTAASVAAILEAQEAGTVTAEPEAHDDMPADLMG